jgi:hypothetical protein
MISVQEVAYDLCRVDAGAELLRGHRRIASAGTIATLWNGRVNSTA